MVSFTSSFTKIAIASLFLAGSASSESKFKQEYFRPSSNQVSGFVNATTPYVRSPCPALNALANHGILPRHGYNITREEYKKAIMDVFHLSNSVASVLTTAIPEPCSLNYLSTHNFIEHDASLGHDDVSYGNDPSKPNVALVEDLISRADDGYLNVKSVASARRARERSCSKKEVKCEYGLKQHPFALGEAAFLLNLLGHDEQIAVDHAKSFFLDERFPSDWVRSPSEVGQIRTLTTIAKVQALVTFGHDD